MLYTDEKAQILKAKFKIPKSTLRTWKQRNKIPDKYKNYKIPKYNPILEKKILDLFRIKDDKGHPIYILHQSNFTSISYIRIQDALRSDNKRVQLSESFCNTFKAELNQSRTLVKQFINQPTEKNFDKITQDKRLVKYVIFKPIYKYLQRRDRNKNAEFKHDELDQAISLSMSFLSKTLI